MIGFVLKCITATWSLQTQIDIVHKHNIGPVFEVFKKKCWWTSCYGTLPHPERPCPLHMGQKWEKRFWRRHKCNPTKLCLASARWHQHRSPAVALEETRNQRQTQNRNGSCCLANQLLSRISGCSYINERAVLVPLPGRLEPVLWLAKRIDIDFK